MSLLVRSTSFLMQRTDYWSSLKKFKINFSEYGKIFSPNFEKNIFKYDVSIIFFKDLISPYSTLLAEKKKEKEKTTKILKLIRNKIKLNKNTNYIFFTSGYDHVNLINSLKKENFYNKLYRLFLDALYKISEQNHNVYVVNIDNSFSDHGLKKCFDNRNFIFLKCRLSSDGLKILVEEINKILESLHQPKKKLLLLDCDNTLWGGVLAEDGIENLDLGGDGIGAAFVEFQKVIKKIKESGVLLVLLSKNNEKDVKHVLLNHKAMILKDNDIAVYKVNWKDKSSNIKDLSEELSLNTNSFVFWDDNPLERNKVRKNFKDLEVIEPDKDISNWSKQLLEYNGFSKHYISKEDLKKTEQYKSRQLFIDSKKFSNNEITFLKKLNIKAKLKKIDNFNLNRAAQLSIKTNQFNFNTKRLSQNEIFRNGKKKCCYIVSLVDDFGDHGYVGLINFIRSKNFIFVNQFLLSCRILGRYLEYWMLKQIIEISKMNKSKYLFFDFLKTPNNSVTQEFIKKNNFKEVNFKSLNKKIYSELIKANLSKSSKILSLPLNSKIKYLNAYGN